MAIVRYMVSDADSATAFYTEHLGFVLEKRWSPAFSIVSRGDLTLWLSGPRTSARRPTPDGREPELELCNIRFSETASSNDLARNF